MDVIGAAHGEHLGALIADIGELSDLLQQDGAAHVGFENDQVGGGILAVIFHGCREATELAVGDGLLEPAISQRLFDDDPGLVMFDEGCDRCPENDFGPRCSMRLLFNPP